MNKEDSSFIYPCFIDANLPQSLEFKREVFSFLDKTIPLNRPIACLKDEQKIFICPKKEKFLVALVEPDFFNNDAPSVNVSIDLSPSSIIKESSCFGILDIIFETTHYYRGTIPQTGIDFVEGNGIEESKKIVAFHNMTSPSEKIFTSSDQIGNTIHSSLNHFFVNEHFFMFGRYATFAEHVLHVINLYLNERQDLVKKIFLPANAIISEQTDLLIHEIKYNSRSALRSSHLTKQEKLSAIDLAIKSLEQFKAEILLTEDDPLPAIPSSVVVRAEENLDHTMRNPSQYLLHKSFFYRKRNKHFERSE